MKKNIFLLLCVTTLSACATFQQQAFDWRGQNFDSYVLNYGVPSSQYTLQDGNNVYSFKTNCPDTNAQEEVLIIINSDNVIQEISRTAACPRVYYEPAPMPVPQEHYTTRHIDTPPQKPAQVKPEPKPLEKPAPKPQVKPEPRPQGQNVAPQQQKPVQDKPAPKPQEQNVNPQLQKPVQDKPAPKPQEQTTSYAQNTKPIENKPGQNAKTSEIFSKQTKEVKITGQESLTNKKNNVLLAGKTEKTNPQKQDISKPAQEVKQETFKAERQEKVAKLFKK